MSVKGASEFQKFEKGKPLTRKQALLAQCYVCNGFEREDCLGVSCPLYQWSPWNKDAKFHPLKRQNPSPKGLIQANLKRKTEAQAPKGA